MEAVAGQSKAAEPAPAAGVQKTFASEEEKIFAGQLFSPGHPELVAKKARCHDLYRAYNRLDDWQVQGRKEILQQLLGGIGEGSGLQGPIYFHYGCHTTIGKGCFMNMNFTVQDDAKVTIGDYNNFGPGVTIVTPVHPMLPDERRTMLDENGKPAHLCYAKPVTIGNDCWFGANVTICPGVTIGDNVVVGAGAVVTRDIPPNSFAAGVPCKVIREITEADSMIHMPEVLGNNRVLEKDQ
ncbi:MAG: sugar O-acetyltransferase [Lachnospiraceae bacterium]|nr:sugar O-acetyltransferase [Lachnospiraceae bacterium]